MIGSQLGRWGGLCHASRYFAARQLLFGAAARKKMLEGTVNLAEAVAVTLGPGG
jgi:hypothetical protein